MVRRTCLLLPLDLDPVRRILGRGPHKLETIGNAYGLTKERVRQIEMAALAAAQPMARRLKMELPEQRRPSVWDLMDDETSGVGVVPRKYAT